MLLPALVKAGWLRSRRDGSSNIAKPPYGFPRSAPYPWGSRMQNLMRCLLVLLALGVAVTHAGPAPQPVNLTVNADQPGATIDPIFYGLMTEEINFSYDGGLYAELIRNRAFKDDAAAPVHWSVVKEGSADGSIALDLSAVPDTALTAALKLDAASASGTGRVGAAN